MKRGEFKARCDEVMVMERFPQIHTALDTSESVQGSQSHSYCYTSKLRQIHTCLIGPRPMVYVPLSASI